MKITAVPCLIFVLSGCASFEPQPLSPTDTIAAYESRTLDNSELQAFIQKNIQHELPAWPLPEWDFDLLTLAALYYHPDLDVARAKWNVAQAGVATAGYPYSDSRPCPYPYSAHSNIRCCNLL